MQCHPLLCSSKTGIYALGRTQLRKLPTATDQLTHEWIHPSVLEQESIQPDDLKVIFKKNPKIIAEYLPLENEVRRTWPFDPARAKAVQASSNEKHQDENTGVVASAKDALKKVGVKATDKLLKSERARTESGEPVYDESWLSRMSKQSNVGPFAAEFGH